MKKIRMISAALIACGALALGAGIGAHADEKPLVYSEGVYVEDICLTGMTLEEAQAAVQTRADEIAATEISLHFDGVDAKTTYKDMGFEWTNPEILEEAITRGKGDTLIQEYMAMTDIEVDGAVYEMDLNISEESIRDFVKKNYSGLDRDPVSAELTREDGEFQVSESQTGRKVDLTATQDELVAAVMTWECKDIDLEVKGEVVQPEHSTEELAQIKDVLGTATTQYNTGNSNRSYNIYNGTSMINGTLLFPGESFSCYEHISPITTGNGYRVATAYENGQEVDSVGGGVCQISTTLYNAVLKAELTVTERYNHSMSVSYIDLAKDSTIAGTSKDLKFTNTSDAPVYIEGVAGGGYVTFTIYGKETRPENRRLEFVSRTISTINPPATIYVDDPGMDVGTERRIQGAHVGYVAELWKMVYEDDVLVEEILLHTDRYNASPARYYRGTRPVETTAESTEESTGESGGETTAVPPETTATPPESTEAPPETTAAPPETTEAPPATTEAPPQTTEAPAEQSGEDSAE